MPSPSCRAFDFSLPRKDAMQRRGARSHRPNAHFPRYMHFDAVEHTPALKHNPKGKICEGDLQWRSWIERRRTSGRQSSPAATAFLPLWFRRARSGVGVSRRPDDHLLGPNQRTRRGGHRGDPLRGVADGRSCFPGVSHPNRASRHEGASRGALQRRTTLRIRVSGRDRRAEADAPPDLRHVGERLLSLSALAH